MINDCIYEIDSGLGGVFSIRFHHKEGGNCVFYPINPGWEEYKIVLSEEKVNNLKKRGG